MLDLKEPKDLLVSWRKKYGEKLSQIGALLDKQEAYRYISSEHLIFPEIAKSESFLPQERKASTLLFIDGFFSQEYSQAPDGIVCLPLDQAIHSYGVFLQNRMVRTLKEEADPLALLNGVSHGKGVFLYIPPEIEITTPINIEYVSTTSDMQMPRIVLYLGKRSHCKIVQNFESSYGVCNAYIDAILDEGSDLCFKSSDHSEGRHFQSIRATLKRESRFAAHLYSEGSELSRTSIKVQLLEEQSEVLLQGLSKLTGRRQNHIHALVSHLAPHTRSRQHFKALLNGQAKSSFEGKIYVHPTAQKTEAYQVSNNLLLSDGAVAYAKPNLEIFADDVKASHGATIAQMDEEELFYLRSRGIPLEEAKQCLVESFCRELKDCIP